MIELTWSYVDYLLLLISYLVGSIPFGLLITRFAGGADIRQHGSGNIGATNVLRVAGKKLALLTLLSDAGKGALMVGVACYTSDTPDLHYYVGGVSVLGHIFPVWLKFKGGKGVATTLAVFLAALPFMGLVACATWLIVFLLRRISSLSAISAMALTPLITYGVYGVSVPFLLTFSLGFIVILKHYENIRRLMQGKEKPSSFRRKDK